MFWQDTNTCTPRRWGYSPGEKGQQSERVVSEARTFPVEKVVKPSSEAVPLHGAVRSKQRNETPRRIYQHRVAGRFVSARSAYCGVSRPTSGTGKPCTLVPNPLPQQASVIALPVRVGVSSSHTTKSLTGGVLSTCVLLPGGAK